MNDMSGNRARSLAVRQEAKAHLAALRQERLAKRRAARPTEPVAPDIETHEPAADIAEEPQAALDASLDEIQDEPAGPAEKVEDITVPDPAVAEMEEPTEPDEVAAIPSEPAPAETDDGIGIYELEAPNDASEVEATQEPDPEPEPETAGTKSDQADAALESDLFRLPGIGPGLVWMLNSAGVHSLSDMAAADAETLAAKLGLVGELLDIDYWIDCAAKA